MGSARPVDAVGHIIPLSYFTGVTSKGTRRRARRALERQLAYQQAKAVRIAGDEAATMAWMADRSAAVRARLAEFRPIDLESNVLEVGSGAHGLIFFFDAADRTGVDPLADHYHRLFPAWQDRARTIAAYGESLPFADASFDIVLCDNVVDHAEAPRRICEELVRVLRPGGLLYFTVNVHHWIYGWASAVHAAWRRVGVPLEVTPFADHTVHLTLEAARRLFAGLPIERLQQLDSIADTRQAPVRERHAGDLFKRLFFKNARYELIAARM